MRVGVCVCVCLCVCVCTTLTHHHGAVALLVHYLCPLSIRRSFKPLPCMYDMYVCRYAYMCACMYVCIYVCMYIYMYVLWVFAHTFFPQFLLTSGSDSEVWAIGLSNPFSLT